VLADAILREEVEATGAEHVAWTRAPQRTTWDPAGAIVRDWEARTPIGAFALARDAIVTGPSAAYAADVMAEVERRRPDVLARDFMLAGVAAAAEAAALAGVLVPDESGAGPASVEDLPRGFHPTGITFEGIASWYGPGFEGNSTANGEIFDPMLLTAAHRTLPFGTVADVKNPTTGQTVRVRINDRGPYVDGRCIDLSRAAFRAIASLDLGHVDVRYEVLK
jgi:hypothetical protein